MKKLTARSMSVLLCLTMLSGAAACTVAPSESVIDKDAACPIIAQQSGDLSLRKGESSQGLEVKAYVNDNGSLSYQWYLCVSDGEAGTAVEGADRSVFSPDTSVSGTAYYYCVITNTNNFVAGEKKAETVSRTVAVNVYYEAEAPRIVRQPESADYVFGAQDVALPVSVEAAVTDGEISYQWFVSDDGIYDTAEKIDGETSASYTPDIGTIGEKYYYCEITNTDADTAESEPETAVTRSNFAAISVDYEYDGFTFEEIDDTACKLVAYDGQSLRPYIPATDGEGRAVVEIGPGVFAGSSITQVTIPDTVEKLGWYNSAAPYGEESDGVFSKCVSLREIRFNGHFTYIGDFTFNQCTALETDVWAYCDRVETICRGAFKAAPLPETLIFPETMSGTLASFSFEICTGVRNISFAGEGITEIGGSAFANIASLETISFPASLTKTGDCLKGCASLKEVTFARSAANHGSVTGGNPFSGTYSTDMTVNVPYDSYEQYKTSLGAFGSYVKQPPADVAYNLTVEGATINGESRMELLVGSTLDAAAQVEYAGDTQCLGWLVNGVYFSDYESLAQSFKMSYGDTLLKAVYEEDFTMPFTPSCITEDKNDSSRRFNMTHAAVGEVTGTRYAFDASGPRYIKITNGGNEPHGAEEGVYNDCPVTALGKSCILMTFVNNSDSAITLRYEAEYFGVIGSVTVTLGAGETKTVLLLENAARDTVNSAYHQMEILDCGESGYDVTVAGRRVI